MTVTSGGSIAMGNGVTSSSDTGTISYNAKDSLSLSNIRTGGRAVFVAPSIIDNAPGVSNVKAWVIDMDSRAANTGVITDLVGETADAALIRLDYRPIGGSLLQSRRFMDELLKPVGMPQHVSLASTVMDMSHGTNPMLAPARLVTDNTSKSLASEEPAATTEE